MEYSKPISFRVHSRASCKIGDSYYTFEYEEERVINETVLPKEQSEREKIIQDERNKTWDIANSEVDKQVEDVLKIYKKK